MSKFTLKIEKSGNDAKVLVAGVVDEDADFAPHSLAGLSNISMDLKGIISINSCGIREWIKWIGIAKSAKISFINCPKVIVDQFNMVQGFLPPTAKVVSFFVPFYSEDSGTEKNILFTNGKEFDESGAVRPPIVNDDAGKPMEMDVIEARYFKFLKK